MRDGELSAVVETPERRSTRSVERPTNAFAVDHRRRRPKRQRRERLFGGRHLSRRRRRRRRCRRAVLVGGRRVQVFHLGQVDQVIVAGFFRRVALRRNFSRSRVDFVFFDLAEGVQF